MAQFFEELLVHLSKSFLETLLQVKQMRNTNSRVRRDMPMQVSHQLQALHLPILQVPRIFVLFSGK